MFRVFHVLSQVNTRVPQPVHHRYRKSVQVFWTFIYRCQGLPLPGGEQNNCIPHREGRRIGEWEDKKMGGREDRTMPRMEGWENAWADGRMRGREDGKMEEWEIGRREDERMRGWEDGRISRFKLGILEYLSRVHSYSFFILLSCKLSLFHYLATDILFHNLTGRPMAPCWSLIKLIQEVTG